VGSKFVPKHAVAHVKDDDALEPDVEDRGIHRENSLQRVGKPASAHGHGKPKTTLLQKRLAVRPGDGTDVRLAATWRQGRCHFTDGYRCASFKIGMQAKLESPHRRLLPEFKV
jgi:hypothetical protein